MCKDAYKVLEVMQQLSDYPKERNSSTWTYVQDRSKGEDACNVIPMTE